MKKIFISYVSEKAYSNCTIEVNDNETICDMSDIQVLQDKIAEAKNLKSVVITNFGLLPLK